ncbi:head maturation protease, ClpP-related [Rhizobium skierniewicense]|uniref:head maturation protease, ClpP-related n=1 Tax=Rhizobium skierniewicense TaxID=984260 RepID=UPI0015723FF4|nr:head maturation protease, ClpP-related [Rhizobium skierniewicense]NTF32313.1 Clp protease ClpP [Rhizobium skierniewicense]
MAVLVNGELILYGFVGDNYWDMGFTAREVIEALAEVGRDADITVRINSGGGYTDDGVSIYNALKAHKGKVTVIVDAVAFSSASLIAMAGQDRIMRKGAMMMIHDPSGGVWGTAQDLESYTKYLQKQADSMAGIYADVSGDEPDDIREEMKTELWLTAEEAVERGFATSVADTKSKAVAAHDYRVYANAPERFVAAATKKNWSHEEATPKAMTSVKAPNRQTQEKPTMTVIPKADETPADIEAAKKEAAKAAVTAYQTRRKNVMALEEAKGREEQAECLIETDLSEDAIKGVLAAGPKSTAQAGGKPQVQTYQEQRISAAAGLAQPGTSERTETESRTPLRASVDRLNKRR